MKRAILLALLLASQPATAAVHAVFVGIDRYENSRTHVRTAGFDDLSGAVADVVRIKAALASARGLALDQAGRDCRSANAISTTLTNECATKAAILAAWDGAIAASRPGDTLILYFAGHGSRFIDSDVGDQASRYNSTLMAHDARRAGGAAGDILDHEVRQYVDAATSRGIRVVTWFDSCNSGTASRDGQSASRTAPELRVSGLAAMVAPRQYGNLGAWRVHFGAAGDGQDAIEAGAVEQRAGVFTAALAAALVAAPKASFADLAAQVVADVTARTGGKQRPHAEGALRATLDGPEVRLPLFEVALDSRRPGQLVMTGGALVGVTAGSRFEIFPSTGAALAADGSAPVTARVTAVNPGQALLRLETAAPAPLQGRLVAREIAHDFGGPVLTLAVQTADALPAVRRLPFVTVAADAPFALLPASGGIALQGRDGEIARLPAASAPDFGLRLAAALEKLARVEQWLAQLRRDGAEVAQGVSLCVAPVQPGTIFDPGRCSPQPTTTPDLALLQPATFGVVNEAAAQRFTYVLAIGRRYSVTLVLPAFGGVDPALQPGQALAPPPGQRLRPNEVGDLVFVALSSDQPLPAGVLEQTGADVADPEACRSPVARAFCVSGSQARSGGGPPARDWSAAIVTARVVP